MEIISTVWFMGKGNNEGNGKGNTYLISHQFDPTGGGGFEWIAIANYGARHWVTIVGADLSSQACMMLLPEVVLAIDVWGLQDPHSSCAHQATGLALQACRMLLCSSNVSSPWMRGGCWSRTHLALVRPI
jgi:hypothetical protein